MPNFAPVDEQLTYLKKGSAEIIREADLRAKLEKSRSTGNPLRVKLGPRRVGWLLSEVLAWIDWRKADRNGQAPQDQQRLALARYARRQH